jgi:hypothetical protein
MTRYRVAALALAAMMVAACSPNGMRGLPATGSPARSSALRLASAIREADRSDRGFLTGPIVIKPAKLTLYGIGTQSKKSITVSETGYSGAFTVGGTCAKIAAISPTSGHGPTFKPAIRGLKSGICSMTFADTKGHKTTLPITDKPGGSLKISLLIPIGGPKAQKPKHLGPHFISPSTQAMTVNIAGPTSLKAISGLTASSTGCTLTLQGLDCTFGASLASCPTSSSNVNCYTATITTYDAYDPATNTIPAGAAPLSTSLTSFTVQDNQSNNVTFNFSGIPAQIIVVPGSVLSVASGNLIDLVGPGQHKMFAEALDADNNIIAGQGAPSFTVGAKQNELGVTFTQPPTGAPRFTVSPPDTLPAVSMPSTATLTVTATFPSTATDGCNVTGAVCSGAVTIDMESLLAVGNQSGATEFAAEKGTGPLNTISGMAVPPLDLAFDTKGNLYIATLLNGTQGSIGAVLEFALGSTIPFRQISTGLAHPIRVVPDDAGNIYVLDDTNAKVLKYAAGATAPQTSTSVGSGATDLAIDSSGDFWVARHDSGTVKFYPSGGGTPVALSGLSHPAGLAWRASNNTLYVSDETTYNPSQSYQCGVSSTYCQILSYAHASAGGATSAVFSSQSFGGHFRIIPSLGLFADNSTGIENAFYPFSQSPPITPSGYAGGLNPGTGVDFAVNQNGNMYITNPFGNVVYGYNYTQFAFQGFVQTINPAITLTGLSHNNAISIIQ